jgi:hypothetical protein
LIRIVNESGSLGTAVDVIISAFPELADVFGR